MKSRTYGIKLLGVTGLLFFSILLYQAVGWTDHHFSGLNFAQIIFHLKVPLAGTDQTIMTSFLDTVLYPALRITSGFLFFHLIYMGVKTKINLNFVLFPRRLEKKHLKLNLFPGPLSLLPVTMVSVIILGMTFHNANTYFNFYGYLGSQLSQSNFIQDQYVEVDGILTFPKEKRNLIYIYLESMESTFGSRSEGGAYKENYIQELTELAKENISFSDKEHALGGNPQTVGTGWTMAAMFSHSTGLPLKLPIEGNSLSDYSAFFPGTTSMGEILKAQGYRNYLMMGSDATFGGRRSFYTQHGDYDIFDYHRALEDQVIPEDYHEWWGLEDQKLYAWAKEKLLEISLRDEPFNFTMLTADTHHEDGYLCELCQDDFDSQYANVLACASWQANEFIQWIKGQDFYENTSIVLVGDHPTMDADFTEDVDREYIRTSYNSFINSAVEGQKNRLQSRDFYSFDFLPTTLASMGVEIKGDRVALGTNLFSEEQTLFEEYGEDMHQKLFQKSRFYDRKFFYNK